MLCLRGFRCYYGHEHEQWLLRCRDALWLCGLQNIMTTDSKAKNQSNKVTDNHNQGNVIHANQNDNAK